MLQLTRYYFTPVRDFYELLFFRLWNERTVPAFQHSLFICLKGIDACFLLLHCTNLG